MHFLITAGGTREYIDPVRFISNASSGRMGYCLAAAAIEAGHKVTLVSAPVGLLPPEGVKIIKTETAGEMFVAVRRNFKNCDCLIMAAAVSDYTPARTERLKIKKGDKNLILKLKPTTDILAWAGSHKKNRIVVGFALEDKNIRKGAEEKLRRKNLDMVIVNTPAAIGAEKSTLLIKTANTEWKKLSAETKSVSARKIISLIDNIRG